MAPPARAQVITSSAQDPRVGLRGGWRDAAEIGRNMVLVAHRDRPDGFFTPGDPGAFPTANSDLAFMGNTLVQGSFHGFQIWDISNPMAPSLRLAFPCPGGQGDPSVYRNLLFISVEQPTGRLDCGANGDTAATIPTANRFRGVRIFDISDIQHPRQVAAIQTCRGSHTHTLVADPNDPNNVYIYVSGSAPPRPAAELAGCSGEQPEKDPNTSLFSIDIIRVPLNAPQQARVVASPRIFANESGNIAGLLRPVIDTSLAHHPSETNRCHDITVYSAIGLAAGACAGNGIVLDIRNPANPKRVAAVSDSNFAFWHSATFNNGGDKIIFTDEWGGGTRAKCTATDDPHWGADALFTLRGNKLSPASYYKLPAAQTEFENCVAHNGSLIPIPGRDIFVQAWYQGGVSVVDFTDIAHPKEIAFFDRGPVDSTKIFLAGEWSAYWYNGHIYGSEISRGLDVFGLQPSSFLTQNEIDAAKTVHLDILNAQNQQRIIWPPSFALSRAYLDQAIRSNAIPETGANFYWRSLEGAEKLNGAARARALRAIAARARLGRSSLRTFSNSVRDLSNLR
ncbi:MAG: hypothetical protein H0W63_07345 [Gemmatimonadaceae bacterium]|nr:hypothetical protein [Gemmatimonadaceae bacterium]